MNNLEDSNSDKKPDSSIEKSIPQLKNEFGEYLTNLSPEMLKQLNKVSLEASYVMQKNLEYTLGQLKGKNFAVNITVEKENLRTLLINATIAGYLIRAAEGRMKLAKSLKQP